MILTLVSDHVCLQQFLPLEPLQSPSPCHWDASPGWMQLHPAYGYCQPGDESYLTCFTQSTSYVFSVTWTMVGHSSALLLLRHCWLFIRQTKAYKAGAGEEREADITVTVYSPPAKRVLLWNLLCFFMLLAWVFISKNHITLLYIRMNVWLMI